MRRASGPVLSILSDVVWQIEGDEVSAAIGASRVGYNKRALASAIERGLLTQTDTGDGNTEGGPFRLHLTDLGREQLRLAEDRGW